jgi:thiol-disulfide isomerase/thioredoxin
VPCRAQHPLIENVQKHFAEAKDIVFLAVDADDDPSLAAPYVKEQGWANPGYLEVGLAQKLTISAIPTVLVLDSAGRVSSRMTGFIPERFEQMLTQRIEEARQNQ